MVGVPSQPLTIVPVPRSYNQRATLVVSFTYKVKPSPNKQLGEFLVGISSKTSESFMTETL